MVFPIFFGGMPNPVQTPPIAVAEDVTKGYVPKSMSNISALAPSTRTFLPSESALWIYTTLSTTYGRKRSARAYRIYVSGKTEQTRLQTNLVPLNLSFSVVFEVSIALEAVLHNGTELGSERVVVEEVVHAETGARRLSGVRRTDAALGSANAGAAEFDLFQSVDDLMEIENKVRAVGHEQTTGAIETCCESPVRLDGGTSSHGYTYLAPPTLPIP